MNIKTITITTFASLLVTITLAGCKDVSPRFVLNDKTVIRGQKIEMISTPQGILAAQLEEITGRKWQMSNSDLIDAQAISNAEQAKSYNNVVFFKYCHSCKPGEFIIDISEKIVVIMASNESGFMNAGKTFTEVLAKDGEVLFVPIPQPKADENSEKPFWKLW